MIKIEHLNKYYNKGKSNEIHVINDTNLELPNIGLITFLGESGSGKTTLSYIIGLLDNKYEGKFYFNNVDVSKLSKKDYNQAREKFISYIFSKNNLIPYLNVKENLDLSNSENNFVDLDMKQDVNTLSGGEEILLALNIEINKKKKIYILDEVTSMLDNDHFNKLMEIINNLSKEVLIIMISHDKRTDKYGKQLKLNKGKLNLI